MCEYCECHELNTYIAIGKFNNNKSVHNFTYLSHISQNRVVNKIKPLWGTKMEFTYKINYCPMCGRKLGDE
jgi:hypothetical protein